MDIGTSFSVSSVSADIAVLARKAEELGFESCWVPEHTIVPVQTDSKYPGTPDGSIPPSMDDMADPLIALARASAVTSTIKLGTSVSLVPEHNPLLMAKQIATLDRLSNGRFIYGIGAGWLKEETEIMGGDFEHRWGQSREAVMAMKELWTKEEAEFHGRFYDFPPVRCAPKPVQKLYPPVILGGATGRIYERTVEWGDGWFPPSTVTYEEVRRGRDTLDRLATAAGRDPKSLEVTVIDKDGHLGLPPSGADVIKRWEESGVDRVLVSLPSKVRDEPLVELERIAQRLRI
jgi:probable F420-dependent oxidoreductase